MTSSSLRRHLPYVVLGILLAYVGCSTGTNTGNGTSPGSGGAGFHIATGGAPNTGGGEGFCIAPEPCDDMVDATGPEGETYRGRVGWDVVIDDATSATDPPVAKLVFLGAEIEESDAGCYSMGSPLSVEIYISAGDSLVDAAGVLLVHSPGRSDSYASGPRPYVEHPDSGWAVELTLTPGGQLTATLSLASESLDGATSVQILKLSGSMLPLCSVGPDGGKTSVTFSVGDGGWFAFPCSPTWNCGFPSG